MSVFEKSLLASPVVAEFQVSDASFCVNCATFRVFALVVHALEDGGSKKRKITHTSFFISLITPLTRLSAKTSHMHKVLRC